MFLGGDSEHVQRRALLSSGEMSCDSDLDDIPVLAILVYLLVLAYAFYGLAVICDEYFISSLEIICERLDLSEDVAGATFMASASSAPELFSNTVDTFGSSNSIGAGTIVGSAMFNILVIIAGSAIFSTEELRVDWRPMVRDIVFYSISIACIMIFFADDEVDWVESLLLILGYVVYTVYMYFNSTIMNKMCKRPDETDSMEMDSFNKMATSIVHKEVDSQNNKRNAAARSRFKSAVSAIIAVNKFEQGLSVKNAKDTKALMKAKMGTGKIGGRAGALLRFRTVVRAVQVQQYWMNLVANSNGVRPSDVTVEMSAGATGAADAAAAAGEEKKSVGAANADFTDLKEAETKTDVVDAVDAGGDDDGDDDDEEPGPFEYYTTLPLMFLMKVSIPDCSQDHLEDWYMATFAMSIVWIGGLSWVLVEFVTKVGCIIGIDPVIMGVTVLAAGTSVPDALGSIAAARNGLADMAVSNAIGSNVFDIFIGMGLPWFIKCVAEDTTINVKTDSLGVLIIILFGTVGGVLGALILNKWTLTKSVGIILAVMYFFFIVYVLVAEYA